MAVKSYSNASPGIRALWAIVDGKPEMAVLHPGASQDLELAYPDRDWERAVIAAGEIIVGEPGQRFGSVAEAEAAKVAAAAAAAKEEMEAALVAAYERGLVDGAKKPGKGAPQ